MLTYGTRGKPFLGGGVSPEVNAKLSIGPGPCKKHTEIPSPISAERVREKTVSLVGVLVKKTIAELISQQAISSDQ